jgi:GntR family transcriptional regulator
MSRTPSPEARPLYAQVKALIIERLLQGQWKPGDALPNEFQLAADFGVSQGTVRKALDELSHENILVRQQGKGTFVAEHTPHGALFHFFRMVDNSGHHLVPDSIPLDTQVRPATRLEQQALAIEAGAEVLAIRRLRNLLGRPAVFERIVVARSRFADLGADGAIPNTLYDLYQSRYGVTVAKATEHLSAQAATADEAALLGIEPGHPLLQIERIATGLDGRPVEYRVSRYITDDIRYLSELF